jgi:signal transduction histidine kinase
MREARAIALRLQADENALLLQRAQREEGTLQVVVTAIALGLILACTLAVLAVYAVRRDDEERRRTERDVLRAKEAAEAANRAKSEFLARMSHELRTPLNAVIGFANALRKNKGGNLRTQDITYLERIVANGNELLSLINDVLDLAKIEAGRVDVAAELVSLDVLMYDVLSQFEPEVANRPITLTCEIDKPLAPFIGDSAKLRQVLTNLIGNAIKFTKEGSVTVHVTTDAVSGEPQRIDVIDTGIGIPADRTGAIFHAFEQADRGTAREYGGTGLGLAIARSLCDRMGYTLAVTSEYLRGSTFSVLLTPSAQTFARTSGEHTTPMHLAG